MTSAPQQTNGAFQPEHDGNTGAHQPTDDLDGFVERKLNTELSSIRSEVSGGRREHILQSLDERGTAQDLVRAQYTGRYPFELLQNANDAAAESPGRRAVRFLLTDNALLVANMGRGFGSEEVEAICSLGRSSKDPRKSIGYKGLGFKSVGEVTLTPQVFSPPFQFGFDADRVRAEVTAASGGDPLPPRQHLPVYAFPFPLRIEDAGEDAAMVQRCLEDGFVTAVRLPFRPGLQRREVEANLTALLTPELLLFLDATDALQLQGTATDFNASRERDSRGDHEHLVLNTNGEQRQWLVWRRKIEVPDQALVAALGESWKNVTHVAAATAVPLDDHGDPADPGKPLPVHVYFPTEDTAGLPLLLHADFALDLDRRHIGRAPETRPYNRWLADQLVGLVTGMVAPRLAAMFPTTAASVNLLAPHPAVGEGGQHIASRYSEEAADVEFLPCRDGKLRSADAARLLPAGLPHPECAEQWLNLSDLGNLVNVDGLSDHAEEWLRRQLQLPALTVADAISRLREPSGDPTETYRWLLEWETQAGSRLWAALGDVRCVRTTAGDWLEPDQVFFPREKEAPDLPVDVPVHIVMVPDLPGLTDLLGRAGVRPFRWRELVTERILPLLTEVETEPDLRRRAHQVLDAYFRSEGSGDQEIHSRLGDVLVPASTADGGSHSLAPADRVYFSAAWTGSDELERLYGSFEACEFLATTVPTSGDERADAESYFGWLGVADRPRLLSAVADTADRYRLGNLARHPHAAFNPWWWQWQQTVSFRRNKTCDQHHPESQQLYESHAVDRLHELLGTEDRDRLLLLAQLLASCWPTYQQAMTATITCRHGSHRGERSRSVPSVLAHMLTTAAWLPCVEQNHLTVAVPSDVWRAAPHLSRRVRSQLPLLDEGLDRRSYAHAWQDLGLVDSARPQADDLVTLLRRLADQNAGSASGHDRGGDVAADVVDTSRWAMKELDEALARSPADQPLADDVPLLARSGERFLFAVQPYLADDPLLIDAWSDQYPVLAVEPDLRALVIWAGLRTLTDLVETHPVPHRPHEDWGDRVAADLDAVKPYLAAVAVESTPSRADQILPRLRSLEILACESLELRYRLGTVERTKAEPTVYIQQRREGEGPRSRIVGRAFLEVRTPDAAPDWYAFGPALADFLLVPRQADAFSLLLTATDAQRRRFLESRHIAEEKVDDVRIHLLLPTVVEDVVGPLPDITNEAASATAASVVHPEETPAAPTTQNSGPTPTAAPTSGPAPATAEEPPPLADEVVTMLDVVDGKVNEPAPTAVQPSAGRRSHSIDWESAVLISQDRGRRGEQWVLRQEQHRVSTAGQSALQVVWQSNNDPESNYDIRSVDEHGRDIYIEVKSTAGTDPAAPFEITSGELRMALRYRDRYWVYRVLDVNSARPQIIRYRDPITMVERGAGALRVASARLYLAPPDSIQEDT